jgi:hypothetical protein
MQRSVNADRALIGRFLLLRAVIGGTSRRPSPQATDLHRSPSLRPIDRSAPYDKSGGCGARQGRLFTTRRRGAAVRVVRARGQFFLSLLPFRSPNPFHCRRPIRLAAADHCARAIYGRQRRFMSVRFIPPRTCCIMAVNASAIVQSICNDPIMNFGLIYSV